MVKRTCASRARRADPAATRTLAATNGGIAEPSLRMRLLRIEQRLIDLRVKLSNL